MKKGSDFKIVKTLGRRTGDYDLYDLCGLSLGKLETIHNALRCYAKGPLAEEILAVIGKIENEQTVQSAPVNF